MSFNPKHIIGKRVASVAMNPFKAYPNSQKENGKKIVHAPVLTFEDGSQLRFVTEETDVGEYGTALVYRPARTRTRKPLREAERIARNIEGVRPLVIETNYDRGVAAGVDLAVNVARRIR